MRIEHIALYVKDLEAARHFFQHYLGAASNQLYHKPPAPGSAPTSCPSTAARGWS